MKYTGTIAGELSGSLGAITASRNRGGAYLRQKVIPVNPNTPRQALIKATINDLSNRWVNTLTTVERAAWDLYAEQVGGSPPPAGLGINIGGLGAYIRGNLARLYSATQLGTALTRIDAAPTVFNLGSFTPIFITAQAAADTVTFNFDNTDDWAGEAGGGMYCYVSPPQNPSVNNFSGRYHLVMVILGDPVPPAMPAVAASDFPFVIGQKIFAQVRTGRADGRYSSAQRVNTIALA